MELSVNGQRYPLEVEPEMPLLWALRDVLHITGPKYGCGIGVCGACSVDIDGQLVRACIVPVGQVQGAVTTIEGVASGSGVARAVQQAWITHQVAQCGYCQPGQIMAAAALLAQQPAPTDAQIDAALASHLCRCGTYPRIREAVHAAAQALEAAR